MSLVWFKSSNTLGLVIVSTFFSLFRNSQFLAVCFGSLLSGIFLFCQALGNLSHLVMHYLGVFTGICAVVFWFYPPTPFFALMQPNWQGSLQTFCLGGPLEILGWHNKNKISSFITLLSNIGKKRENFSGGQFPPWPPLGCAPAHCITLPLLGLCIHCGSPG